MSCLMGSLLSVGNLPTEVLLHIFELVNEQDYEEVIRKDEGVDGDSLDQVDSDDSVDSDEEEENISKTVLSPLKRS